MRDPARLHECLEHVFYEFEMLTELAADQLNRAIALNGPSGTDRARHCHRNALIEALPLHFRCVADFFRLEKGRPDDLRALDYIRSWKASVQEIEACESDEDRGQFERHWERAHKEVAHLTSRRIEGVSDAKNWVATEFVPAALRRCIKFTEELQATGLTAQHEDPWRRLLERMRVVLASLLVRKTGVGQGAPSVQRFQPPCPVGTPGLESCTSVVHSTDAGTSAFERFSR